MGQPRKYGVIKDMDTAALFINALNTSGDSSIGIASEYLDKEAEAKAWAELAVNGEVNETVSDEAMKYLFQSMTVGTAADVIQTSQALRITNNDPNHVLLYVQPYDTSLGVPVTRIYIKQQHIVGGDSITQLGSINSNGWAPAVAYEITQTKEGDILCKFAWCSTECPTDEKSLKKIFSCLSIHCYLAKIEGTGANEKCVIAHAGVNHSAAVFGAKAPCGGFVLHKMANPNKSNGRYGLTVFSVDGTPLYSWCGNGGSPAVVADGRPMYVNWGSRNGGVGRHIVEASGFEDPPIKLGVLGPIFCTSVGDVAVRAKWMQQGPHDYSYFDKSGHISMSKGRNAESVYFADHGIFLYDGTVDDYTTDNKTLPSNKPQNAVVTVKPMPTDPIPYEAEFPGYYDPIGLSASGWASAGDDNDINFFGGVQVLSDSANGENFARFVTSADAFSYGLAEVAIDIPSQTEQTDSLETTLIVVGKTNITASSSNWHYAASHGIFSTDHVAFTYQRAYSMLCNLGPQVQGQQYSYNHGDSWSTTGSTQQRYEYTRGRVNGMINDGTVRYISILRMLWTKYGEPRIVGCIIYDVPNSSGTASAIADPNSRLGQLIVEARHWNAMLALGCMVDHTSSGNAAYKNMRTNWGASGYELVHGEAYGYGGFYLNQVNDIYWVGYKDKATNANLMSQLTYLKNRFFVTTKNLPVPTIPNL